ncbi:citrate lyase subunit alpha [Acetonema longum]|uniref:Citrate lyase alpha chain n=1 Tax=Acetonema longum DSM 6540 TaxID=1009370 RepID=F7NNY9_9FIRM|nr:citrate lyase subunit alpha [Acetonema longum]EGO62323.1 citrate lyase subunit alpha [Acetonema longum DSM 6540]
MINAAGRDIPASIPGYHTVKPYRGPFATQPDGRMAGKKLAAFAPGRQKVLASLEEAIEASGLKDGMTISFHHSLRNGDYVINMMVEAIARRGIKGLTLAPSSFLDNNDKIIPFIEQGVITAVETSGARGKLGKYLTMQTPGKPTIIRSHGGRARAIEAGELHIDVAFIAAPACDRYGNINGVQGPAACGSMGYAMVDAAYADTVVAITDNLVEGMLAPVSIPMTQVDYIVQVDCIGDPKGIASGSLRYTSNPRELLIADMAARVMEYSGYFKSGFGMQLGAGAASAAAGRFLREKMIKQNIKADFAIGGILAPFVELLEEGLVKNMFDVQDFDIRAIESLRDNPSHHEMSCSFYANPHNRGSIANQLDFVILAATEVDVNFNVNVITDSNGVIMGASGGHSDASAGANCTIVVAPLLRGRLPMVIDNVQTIVTPGDSVDVIVTERGVAVNPKRADLLENLKHAGLPLMSIHDLKKIGYEMGGAPAPIKLSDEIVGVVEYRDGTVIDVIRRPVL